MIKILRFPMITTKCTHDSNSTHALVLVSTEDATFLLKDDVKYKTYITFATTECIQVLKRTATHVRKSFKLKIIHLSCLSTMHTWEVFSFIA